MTDAEDDGSEQPLRSAHNERHTRDDTNAGEACTSPENLLLDSHRLRAQRHADADFPHLASVKTAAAVKPGMRRRLRKV